MYKHILVAVDESDTSRLALAEAINLAKDQDATLSIAYIAVEYVPVAEGVPVDFKKHEANVRANAQDLLKEMVEQARKKHKKVKSRLVELTESENIAKHIIAEAEKADADLIVMGTHGRSGLSRLLLGSVAEEVLRATTIPVHVVRSPK